MDDKKFIISRKELLVKELGVLLAGYVLKIGRAHV